MHFVSLSFIYTHVCTCFQVTLKSLKTPFINNPTYFDPLISSSVISSFISSLSCCYSIIKMFNCVVFSLGPYSCLFSRNHVAKRNTWIVGKPSICKYCITNKYWSMNSRLAILTPSFKWQT